MFNSTIFFIVACCILVLSIISINTGPILTLTVGMDWGDLNCQILSDEYDYLKETEFKDLSPEEEEENDYYYGDPLKRCKWRIGMYYMEHIAFVFDIIIGFICGLLGFVHFLQIANDLIKKTGLIGIISGIIGFILTFIYIVYNGLVYTKDFYVLSQYDLFEEEGVFKRDSEGVYAELVGPERYKCLYYENYGDFYSLMAKYSDYFKKQYNYNKDLYFNNYESNIVQKCTNEDYIYNCIYDEYFTVSITYKDDNGEYRFCPKLYMQTIDAVILKNISAKFLSTLILSIFICLSCISLIIFGFFLIKTPEL